MNISDRISRLTGQLKGIEKMVISGRDTYEVLQQVMAVKKAINGLCCDIVLPSIAEGKSDKEKAELEKTLARLIDL